MFHGERAPLSTSGGGLLRDKRTRSYGSLVQSNLSPVRQRRIEHQVQPGETLQGLALKYGVSMEQIKRANRLYTNDSIFIKKSLSIPVLSDYTSDANNGVDVTEKDSGQVQDSTSKECSTQNGKPVNNSEKTQEGISELSPMNFLKRMDRMISQSKQAAVKRCQEGEKRSTSLEAACTSKTTDRRFTRSNSATVVTSPRMHQQAILGAVPLTITKCTKKLREREDEIFEL
ncbi:lysM and putative peptidoglycan-binding domain-containing protein 1 [Salmo salar]|uniref:LysM and putative peptidoglycan-binding domain-containing protein 1 n=1 Tax=Salmo salar TaxID=8030 RepID=A0A1S3RWX5_SALSA|nr:lysM and putative peptidoglycan-binding domain-containing protein 1 [Salmo salar]|eukprot:XP_014056304.1 PREDICTED: lysM and putative peptidoglycan-binding domain-containing protein 1-like [Salmo salar]